MLIYWKLIAPLEFDCKKTTESHKSVEKKHIWVKNKTVVNTSTIRGKQRNNRNTEVQQKTKRQCNTHRNNL